MGLFDFLKKLKKSKEPESVLFENIEDWLKKQVSEKHLDEIVDQTREEILDSVSEAKKALKVLEDASLMNEKIPEREKHIMQGHRRTYIQKMNRFLNEVEIPSNHSEAGDFAASFSQRLSSFSEDTQKNFAVLDHFFGNELSKLIANVKKIGNSLSKLQSRIENEGIHEINEAKHKLKEYKNEVNRKVVLEENKANKEDEINSLNEKKKKLENKIVELKQSNEYIKQKEIIDKKKTLEDQINNIKTELINLFTSIDRPLKKYKHASLNEKLVDKYLSDPADTLEGDDSLVILDVLKKLSNNPQEFDVKDSQLKTINKINKDFLMNRKLDLSRLKGLNQKAASFLRQNIIALTISENETLIKSVENKIKLRNEELEKIKADINTINPDYLKEKVKEKVSKVGNIIVKEETKDEEVDPDNKEGKKESEDDEQIN